MEKITISSSLRHRELIRKAIEDFGKIGIVALFPNLDATAKEEPTLEIMKQIEAEHFAAIDMSDALYVICPEGKIGTLVSVEIGYTRKQMKPIYVSRQPVDLGLQALVTQVISLERIAEGRFLS